jgi:predicted transcriptional regulator
MEINASANAFLALGQELRLKIFHRIVHAWPLGIRPNELKVDLAIPQATLSFHLKHLLQAKFITVEKERTSLYYLANKNKLQEMIKELQLIEEKMDQTMLIAQAKPRIKVKLE